MEPEDVLRATMTRFADLVRRRDADGLAALYEPDALFVPRQGPELRGRAAIQASFAGLFALEPTLELDVREAHVVGDLGFVANDWVLAGQTPDGQPIRDEGRSAIVLRRGADGAFRIAIDRP